MSDGSALYGDGHRADVEFDSDGVTLRGWHFTPSDSGTPAPVIVMSHGYAAVKEMYLDRYAEPDKGWTDRDEGRWSAPYWWVDAGMAAMAMLLRAVSDCDWRS